MKMKALLGMLLLSLPLCMMAQEDDAYFVPSKAKKKAEKEQRERERQERAEALQAYYASQYAQEEVYDDYEEAPDYHVGALRNDDEYNRRYKKSSGQTLVVEGDSVYFKEEPETAPAKKKGQKEEYLYDDYEQDMDYGYSGRLVRFYGGVRSPFYWDYYYDWAYDPWFRYGWSYDPWYYDYAFGWGYHSWYGRPWHLGYYGAWYDPWCFGGYYDPWYHGYYYGYGGWHYPHYGTVVHSNYAYNRPGRQGALYGGRSSVGNRAGAGISSNRAVRGSLAGNSAGRANGREGYLSSSRATTSRTGTVNQRNNGQLTTNRTATNDRTSILNSRNQQANQRTTTTQPQSTRQTTTTSRTTTNMSSSRSTSSSTSSMGSSMSSSRSVGSSMSTGGGMSSGSSSRGGGGRSGR